MSILQHVSKRLGYSRWHSPTEWFSYRLLAKQSVCFAAMFLLVFSNSSEGGDVSVELPNKSIAATPTTPVEKPKKPKPLFQHGSYPSAWKAAQQSNRPILIFVSMPSCSHCVKMLDQTYHRPDVEKIVRGSFETVCVGRHSHAALVRKLHVKWYPTTILVSPNNKVLDKMEGYVDAKSFSRRLKIGVAALKKTTQTQIALAPSSSR